MVEVSATKMYLLYYQHWIPWTKAQNGDMDSNNNYATYTYERTMNMIPKLLGIE